MTASDKHLLFTPALSMPWQNTQSATVRSLERVTVAGMAGETGETGETGAFRTRVSRFLHHHERLTLDTDSAAWAGKCPLLASGAPGGRYAVGRLIPADRRRPVVSQAPGDYPAAQRRRRRRGGPRPCFFVAQLKCL